MAQKQFMQTSNLLITVFLYFETKELINFQTLSKIFYSKVVPTTMWRQKKYAQISPFMLTLNLLASLNYRNAKALHEYLKKEDWELSIDHIKWPSVTRTQFQEPPTFSAVSHYDCESFLMKLKKESGCLTFYQISPNIIRDEKVFKG